MGGPQMDILRVTAATQKIGINTTVLLPNRYSDYFVSSLVENNIPYILASITTLQKNYRQVFWYLIKFIPELINLFLIIRSLNPDIVHIGGGSWQIKGVLASKLAGKKIVWHLNDTKTPWILKLQFNLLRPLADSFIVAGYRVGEYYLENISSNKVCNISAPVDCVLFNENLVYSKTKKYGSDQAIKIITVANISPVKGLEFFLQVAAKLNKLDNSLLEFRIVGSVNSSQKVYFDKLLSMKEEYSLDNLSFIQGVDDVRSELAAADIYFCSSISEASPTSVWEAMAMSKAIVSSDVGEVDDVVNDGESGFIVPVGDVGGMVNRIIYLIRNPNVRDKFGTKARAVALSRLDLPVIATQHVKVYESIL